MRRAFQIQLIYIIAPPSAFPSQDIICGYLMLLLAAWRFYASYFKTITTHELQTKAS